MYLAIQWIVAVELSVVLLQTVWRPQTTGASLEIVLYPQLLATVVTQWSERIGDQPTQWLWHATLDVWLATLLFMGILFYAAMRPSLAGLVTCSTLALGVLTQALVRRLLLAIPAPGDQLLFDFFASAVLYLGGRIAMLSLDMLFQPMIWNVAAAVWAFSEAFLVLFYALGDAGAWKRATDPSDLPLLVLICLVQLLVCMAVRIWQPSAFDGGHCVGDSLSPRYRAADSFESI